MANVGSTVVVHFPESRQFVEGKVLKRAFNDQGIITVYKVQFAGGVDPDGTWVEAEHVYEIERG